MYYEEVIIEPGNTISGLGVEYGYKASQWPKIWDDPRNADLKKKRGLPQKIQPGDVVKIPIPWKVVSKTLNADANGALMLVNRDGEPGKRLSWVQTVYRHNQPIGPNPAAHCVDGCTPDDNLPFYWTDAEVASPPQWMATATGDPKVSLRKTFGDHASRSNPTAAQGTTKWRAIVSIAVVTGRRVTVYDSWVWGFDLPPTGGATKVGPTQASKGEITGHLNLLTKGWGTLAANLSGITLLKGLVPYVTFGAMGWTFRSPPAS
jgi:hypothetical protein